MAMEITKTELKSMFEKQELSIEEKVRGLFEVKNKEGMSLFEVQNKKIKELEERIEKLENIINEMNSK